MGLGGGIKKVDVRARQIFKGTGVSLLLPNLLLQFAAIFGGFSEELVGESKFDGDNIPAVIEVSGIHILLLGRETSL